MIADPNMAASAADHAQGVLPPHNIDAEMSLLGSMMLDRDAISNILPIIGREDKHWFYRPDHELLFDALIDIYDANREIDLVTVSDHLRQKQLLDQVGGLAYLVTLAESVPSAANAEHYAKIVCDKGMLRDLIRCVSQISQDAFADNLPANELIDLAEQEFFAVTERRISGHAVQIREMLETIYAQVEAGEESYSSGVASGFTALDDLTSGFQPGDFIIVAGRPSMGKTAFGLTIATHMAVDDNIPVAFFSMEMSNQQVAQRILCSRGEVNSYRFRKRQISEEEIRHLGQLICEQLAPAPLYVDDTPGMTIMEMRAKIRRLVRQHDIKAVFVDYLQLMHVPKSESRQQEIATISRGLKGVGRELNIPIIAMAQLNRQAEGREGHKPRMSDLRESGALEQDADVIILLHREEYYKPDNPDNAGIAEIIIAKQRNGPVDTIKLQFNKQLTKFNNLSMTADHGDYTSAHGAPF